MTYSYPCTTFHLSRSEQLEILLSNVSLSLKYRVAHSLMVECETIIVLKRKRLDGVVPVFYQDSNGDRGVAIWKKDKFVTLSFEKMKHDIVAWMAIPNGVI